MGKSTSAKVLFSLHFCVIMVLFVFSRTCAEDGWGTADDWGTFQDWGTTQDWRTSQERDVSQQSQPNGKKGHPFIVNFDKNNDGKVSEEEFPGGDMGFERFDVNQDGYIDKTEAPKGPPSRDKKPGGFVTKFDRDNDGKVSEEEFPGGEIGFEKYDANKDGYIDQAEAPKAPPPHRRKGSDLAGKSVKDKGGEVPKDIFPNVYVSFAKPEMNKEGGIIGRNDILRDILGRTVEGWTFEAKAPCRIRILHTEHKKSAAVVCLSFKAVQYAPGKGRRAWLGKQGKLSLQYGYNEKGWELTHIKARGLSELGEDDVYCVRKTAGHPLLVAVDEGDVETVQSLLDGNGNANDRGMRGETALMMAAGRGHVDVARVLVKRGADVNATSKLGWTALMFAASARQPPMVKFLLDKGAGANCKGPSGLTPLLLALEERPGQSQEPEKDLVCMVTALVDRGANVNAKDDRGGYTALWFAMKGGYEDVIRVLLDNGANVNMVAGETDLTTGLTPLMQAVKMGCPSVVNMLLEKGADVNAREGDVTALRLAKAKKSLELIQLLKEAGATE